MAVSLGHTDGAKRVLLHARIPFRHATLAQLRFDILNNGRITANAGTGIQPSAKGTITFGTPRVDGTPIPNAFANWVGTSGISGRGATVGYVLTPDLDAIFRPLQPTDGHPLPVLVTPAIAAAAGPHGIIPLDIEGEQIAARVVGVVQRFPSIDGDAVVADLTQAATRLDTRSPGLGTPDELWLDEHNPAAHAGAHGHLACRHARAPPRRPARARCADHARRHRRSRAAARSARARALGRRRRARRPRRALRPRGAGRVAGNDQNAPPTPRARSSPPSACVGGLALGAILSALVISLVSVTAGAAEPEPPLRLSLDVPLLALAAVAYIAAAMVLVGARDHATRACACARSGGGGVTTTAIELRDVFRVHSTPEGDAAALQGLSLRIAERRGADSARPERARASRRCCACSPGSSGRPPGIVRVYGEELGKLPARGLARYRSTMLGYADQHYARALAPELTARELVAMQLGLRGAARAERLRRADELLERVGLGAKRDRRPDAALRRRAAARRALRSPGAPPAVFLADEPTGELDAATADQVYDVLGRARARARAARR